MTSPISSPQNLFAIERMSLSGSAPSWAAWFAIALPVSLSGCAFCWALLCVAYRDPEFTHVRQVPAVRVRPCALVVLGARIVAPSGSGI